jgi:hypothetical protein
MDATPLTVGQELLVMCTVKLWFEGGKKHLSALIRSSLRWNCSRHRIKHSAGYDVTVAKYIAESQDILL